MSSHIERAKEQITQALIQQYIKLHPGVDERQVVMKCQEGKLLFSDIASILAERKANQNFEETLAQSAKMVASLAVQENERWADCCASTEHSRCILDCLNSSTFSYIDTLTWREEYNYLKKEERLCASSTIALESTKEDLNSLKGNGQSLRTKEGRKLLVRYLTEHVEQLKVLHRVLKKEVGLGETFEEKARDYIEVQFNRLERKPNPFKMETRDFNKIFKALKNDDKQKLFDEQVLEMNKDLLLQTKETLTKAVDELKDHNEKRRNQFHELWQSILVMENTVKEVNEVQDESEMDPKQRMARYSNLSRKRR